MLFRQTPTPSPKTEEVQGVGPIHIISKNSELNFQTGPVSVMKAEPIDIPKKFPEKILRPRFVLPRNKTPHVKGNSAICGPI